MPGSDPTGTGYDPEAVRAKYLAERDKRLVPDRADIRDLRTDEHFARYRDDPFTPFVERDPVADDVDVVIVGGGIAGILAGAHLRKAGIERIRIIDQAGGIGGTWYWNRYPGVMCDVESYIYMPMLEELDYIPTQRYAFGEEILDHLEAVADRFDLVDDALFHTGVTRAEWHEDAARWRISTDRGDEVSCRWYVLAVGILNLLKLPTIPGMEDFAGRSFHTARWDYEYTGGGPHEPLTGLADKVGRPHRHRGHRHPVRAAPGRVGRAASTCSSARRRPSASGATGPPNPTSPTASSRAGSGPAWTTSRRSSWAGPSRSTWWTTGGRTTTPARRNVPRREGMTTEEYLRSAEEVDFQIMEAHRQPGRGAGDRPGHGGDPQALLPLPVQAAVLPRRVPARPQQPQRHAGRLPGRDRADHRAGPGRRRAAVRGRLHHLRHRLRGRAHPAVPSRRPRHRRSRRRHPGREVGRRRRQPVRDDEPRLPQHVRHAGAGPAGGGDRQLHAAGRARRRVHRPAPSGCSSGRASRCST